MLRNLKFSLIILVSSFCATGCDSFLEADSAGRASIPVFFSDVDGIVAAVPGAYSRVYEYYDSEFYLYPDVAGDMLEMSVVGDDVEMISQYNYASESDQEATAVGHIWQKGYEALANVNNILEYQPILLDEFPSSEDQLQRIKAEALFLRALIHFDLVRVYAQTYSYTDDASHIGVPALTITPAENELHSRNSTAEVYDQIVTDLQDAIVLFNQFSDNDQAPFRASEVASRSLLSKVYLYKQDWELAAEQSAIVLQSKVLTPREDYVDMFRTLDVGEEAIFVLSGEQKSSGVGDFYATSGPMATASPKLIEVFTDTNDIRLDLFQQSSGTFQTLKYSRPEVNQTEFGTDFMVIRASEVLLINAEAEIELNNFNKAKDDLKQIKARALGVAPESLQIVENTKEELLEVLKQERIKELSFEGQRLFDITRWHEDLIRNENTSSNIQELAYPNYLFALPIPLTEINSNDNIIQNEGY